MPGVMTPRKRKKKKKPKQLKFGFAKGEPPKLKMRRLTGSTPKYGAFHELGDKLIGEIHQSNKRGDTAISLVNLSQGLKTKKPLVVGNSFLENNDHFRMPSKVQEINPKIDLKSTAMIAYGLNYDKIRKAGFRVRDFQRKGLTRQMVTQLEKKAQEKGLKLVWAQVYTRNEGSRELLRNLGYTEVPSGPSLVFYYKKLKPKKGPTKKESTKAEAKPVEVKKSMMLLKPRSPKQLEFNFYEKKPGRQKIRRWMGKTKRYHAFHKIGGKLIGEERYESGVDLVHLKAGVKEKDPEIIARGMLSGVSGWHLVVRKYPELQKAKFVAIGRTVKKEFRGRGIGTVLLKSLAEIAQEGGAEYLNSLTDKDNFAARKSLKKAGFTEVEFKSEPTVTYFKKLEPKKK